MTTPIAAAGALAVAAAVKTVSAGKATAQPSFGSALSAAQHTTTTPVVRPESNRDEDSQQSQGNRPRANQGETPQHHTIPTRAPAPARGSAPAPRKSATAHPVAENDVAAATAVQAAPTTSATPAPTEAATADGTAAVPGVTGPADDATAPALPLATGNRPATDPETGLPVGATTTSPTGAVPAAADQPVAPVPTTDQPPSQQPSAQPTATQPTAAQPDGQPAATVRQAVTAPAQQPTPAVAEAATPAATAAQATAAAAQHHRPGDAAGDTASADGQPAAAVTVTSTSSASQSGTADGDPSGGDRDSATKGQAATPHARPAVVGQDQHGSAAAYATVVDRDTAPAATTAGSESRPMPEMPATQALPAGTMDRVNAAEHSVRVQVETDGLGRVTADLHSRPGELGVHLSVPDDAGRAFMAQRMDALRDSLGQSGTAVHLSLAAQDQSFQSSQGQQGSPPREDSALAQSAPQPHDAATPRATDGSPVTPAPADGNRLVDVRA